MGLVGLAACHHPPPPLLVVQDPATLLARALALPMTPAVSNRFGIHIHTPEQDVTAWGALVVRAPDHFRIEIAGPIGPPVVIVACDGADVNAWVSTKQTFYAGVDADQTLRRITGGAAGLEVVTAMLVGQLPAVLGTPAGSASEPPFVWSWWWTAPDGSRLTTGLDTRTSRLTHVRAQDPEGRVLLGARFTNADLTSRYPTRLSADLPTLYTSVQVDFGEWHPATPTDAAFRISAPAGTTIETLGAPAAP
ncbi:MAG: hypothetical protein EXR69_15110 [Myxococcales bacterium]|nr:hypothetical protein [Myxococcales bacterium]